MKVQSQARVVKTMIVATAISFTAVLPGFATTLSDTYSGYYAFGDSLSDDGKLDGIIGFAAPSDAGRFSNGPVWAETLAAQFTAAGKQALNLAIAGATAFGPDTAGATRLSSFSGQVGQFGDALGLGGVISGTNPLVSVWMGANDLFGIIQSVAPASAAAAAKGVAQAVESNIRAIAALGGQYDDFVVLNLPDLGRLPAFSTLLGDPSGVQNPSLYASYVGAQFNAQLALSLESLRKDGLNVTAFDTRTLFDEILNGSVQDDFGAFAGMDLRMPCTIKLSDPNGAACSNPDDFFFADAVHPNRIVHQVLAGRVSQAVSAVPLPAGAPLMLAGIAAFGFIRTRRAGHEAQSTAAI